MLDFRPPVTEDRKWVAPIISHAKRFGCDYSFGDMFIWQHVYNIRIASHDGFLFSINGTDDDNGVKRPTYGFPVGEGDLKAAIELIEEDSACFLKILNICSICLYRTVTSIMSGTYVAISSVSVLAIAVIVAVFLLRHVDTVDNDRHLWQLMI